MNFAHAHLILNHVPIMGGLLGTIFLFAVIYTNNTKLTRLGLWMYVMIMLIGLPVFLSGGALEYRLFLRGVDDYPVSQHVLIASATLALIGIMGLASFLGLYFTREKKELPKAFVTLMVLFALVVGGFVVHTANTGGAISHPEAQMITQDNNYNQPIDKQALKKLLVNNK